MSSAPPKRTGLKPAPTDRSAAKPSRGKHARPSGSGAAFTKPPSQRQLRVAEEIRHVLAEIFGRGDVRDPELVGTIITVTEVRLGPDMKRATAFVARLGHSDVEARLPALRRAAPYLRSCVAKSLKLRHVPDLSFQADTSIDYAMYVDHLLRAPDVARDLAKHPDHE